MKVFSYFDPVPDIDSAKEAQLAALWRRSWASSELIPVMLTHQMAHAHRRYAEFDALVRALPSSNPPGYDLACWHRWLALDVAGGGLMTDYDVICRAFDPELLQFPDPVTILDRGGVPCAVYTTAAGAAQLVDDILKFPHAHDGKHYSDMLFFQAKNYPRAGTLTAPYDSPEFPTAPAVHFSHRDCGTLAPGFDRFIIVRKEMSDVFYTPESIAASGLDKVNLRPNLG